MSTIGEDVTSASEGINGPFMEPLGNALTKWGLVFKEASATEMAQAFRKRVPVVKEFIPDVAADIKATVGDWTGESRLVSDFKVDLEAMSSFVESLSSFEEKAKEYDVEDWVPNSGMLEKRVPTTCVKRLRLPPVRSVALWVLIASTWRRLKSIWERDLTWVLLRMVHRFLRSVEILVVFRRAPR